MSLCVSFWRAAISWKMKMLKNFVFLSNLKICQKRFCNKYYLRVSFVTFDNFGFVFFFHRTCRFDRVKTNFSIYSDWFGMFYFVQILFFVSLYRRRSVRVREQTLSPQRMLNQSKWSNKRTINLEIFFIFFFLFTETQRWMSWNLHWLHQIVAEKFSRKSIENFGQSSFVALGFESS